MRENSLVGLPSIMYEATVNGPPAKPTTAVLPSSSLRTSRIASKSSGVDSRGSTMRSAATSAADRTGAWMIGPTPGSIEKGTPIPMSGNMMSAYITAASTPNSSTGMSVTRAQSSGVRVMVRMS